MYPAIIGCLVRVNSSEKEMNEEKKINLVQRDSFSLQRRLNEFTEGQMSDIQIVLFSREIYIAHFNVICIQMHQITKYLMIMREQFLP